MPAKAKNPIIANALVIVFVLFVLVLGIFFGTQIQKAPTRFVEPVEKVTSLEQADKTTTNVGNSLVAAAGTIDKIIEKATK